MKGLPLISVVMPVFNSEQYLNKSIKSVLEQTYDNFEFLIINDGSTDNSNSIIKKYQSQDKRITILAQENKGITKSLNNGIKHSKGRFIARMDADDICHPDRFKMQLKWFQNNKDIDVLGSQVEFIEKNGNIIKPSNQLPLDDLSIKWELIFGTPLIHPSLMIRKSVFEEFGLYNESYLFAQDLAFWRKIATNSKFGNLPHRLMQIRQQNPPSMDKLKKQNDVRFSTLKRYLNECCGKNRLNKNEIQFSEYFISGKPIIKEHDGFFRLISEIKNGFININCDSKQKIKNINYNTSKIFLRAILYNSNSFMLQIQLLISSVISFPIIIIQKIFWWHFKQIVLCDFKEIDHSK